MSSGRAAALVAIVLLPACVLQRPDSGGIDGNASVANVDWAARRTELVARQDWDARGRIAVRSERGGGQGDLQWEQRGEATHLRLNGPFGAGAYELRWNTRELTVLGKDGKFSRTYDGADAMNDFLAEQLGWPFPASSVRFWLLGVPDPAAAPAAQRFDEHGGLTAIEQAGWSIVYEKFARTGGEWLPTRVTLEAPMARIRMAVDQWDLR